MNLIPREPGKSPNGWCTWGVQCGIPTGAPSNRGGSGRDAVIEENILWWAEHLWARIRGDLHLMVDDGWDVPYGLDMFKDRSRFGALKLSEERFPSFKGTPMERLRALNEKIQSFGWRSTGLWIAAQCEGEEPDGHNLRSDADCEAYWRERIQWCRDAGIEYWKVDWGVRDKVPSFRKMMSDMARAEAPGLWVEHCYCLPSLNNIENGGNGNYADWDHAMKVSLELLRFSDVFRSQDWYQYMSEVVTLGRIGAWLKHGKVDASAKGILQCEDNAYMGAALGCTIGAMRVHDSEARQHWPAGGDEFVRSILWHRIAPPFGFEATSRHVSDALLTDYALVDERHWWKPAAGKNVQQLAPAVISRGMALPTVTADGEPPFVVASRHPDGPQSVATVARCLGEKWGALPLADVTMQVSDVTQPIGIFGRYKTLTLELPEMPENGIWWAQDVLADEAVDISARLEPHGCCVTLSGALIDEIGLAAASKDDPSAPGMVLKWQANPI